MQFDYTFSSYDWEFRFIVNPITSLQSRANVQLNIQRPLLLPFTQPNNKPDTKSKQQA
jgi:hypothetical protein